MTANSVTNPQWRAKKHQKQDVIGQQNWMTKTENWMTAAAAEAKRHQKWTMNLKCQCWKRKIQTVDWKCRHQKEKLSK